MDMKESELRDMINDVMDGLEHLRIINLDFLYGQEFAVAKGVIELAIKEYDPDDGDIFLKACLYIFDHCLMFLCGYLETGERHQAVKQLTKIERLVADVLKRHEVNEEIKNQLVDAIVEAGIPISNKLKQAWINEFKEAKNFLQEIENDPIAVLNELIETLFEDTEDSYEVFDRLFTQISFLESPMILQAMEIFLNSSVVPAREIPYILLLHPEANIRKSIAQMLLLHVSSATLSPVSLRRLILMRNWLPESEHKAIDILIKKAREIGIDCSANNVATIEKLYATPIDAHGIQALILMCRQELGHKTMCGFLIKEGRGIKDTWLFPSLTPAETKVLLAEITAIQELKMKSVTWEKFEAIAAKALRDGLVNHHVPPIELLRIVEICDLPLLAPSEQIIE